MSAPRNGNAVALHKRTKCRARRSPTAKAATLARRTWSESVNNARTLAAAAGRFIVESGREREKAGNRHPSERESPVTRPGISLAGNPDTAVTRRRDRGSEGRGATSRPGDDVGSRTRRPVRVRAPWSARSAAVSPSGEEKFEYHSIIALASKAELSLVPFSVRFGENEHVRMEKVRDLLMARVLRWSAPQPAPFVSYECKVSKPSYARATGVSDSCGVSCTSRALVFEGSQGGSRPRTQPPTRRCSPRAASTGSSVAPFVVGRVPSLAFAHGVEKLRQLGGDPVFSNPWQTVPGLVLEYYYIS